MASGFWRKASLEQAGYERRLAYALAMLLALWCRPAAADVDLVLSSAGYIGAWEVAGPYAPAAVSGLQVWALTPSAGSVVSKRWGGVWRPHGVANGAIDLKSLLATGPRGGRVALAAGQLVLSGGFDGWLLLSADGSVDARVDGKSIWARTSTRLRGSSWDAIPLELGPGVHQVLLVLTHPGQHWAFEARLLDRIHLRPPADARWRLPGAQEQLARQLQRTLAEVQLHAGLEPGGFHPLVRVSYPRGMPALATPVAVTVDSTQPQQSFQLGDVVVNTRGAHPLEAHLPRWTASDLAPGTRNAQVTVRVAGHRFETRVSVSRRAIDLRTKAAALLERLPDDGSLEREVVRATTDWLSRKLVASADSRHAYELAEAAQRLERWLTSLADGSLPFLEPGIHALAHYSDLDDAPQPFRVHVPRGFDPAGARNYALVLALHGYNGSPEGIMHAFLDSHSQNASASVDGFVIAPMAHGNAFYRGPGEHEAMRVLGLAKRLYPIDPARVAITGVSMGGTGAAQLALTYPDEFAAAAPLCGYHSYFIRRDTRDRPLRPWEKARMEHWSTSRWVANGHHLPLFVAHGTHDHPLENSKVLIRAYRELGQPVDEEWPDTGHSVWKVSYRGARLWPWLTRHRRPDFPEHVTVRTDALRYGTQYWVGLTRFERHGQMGEVDARREKGGGYSLTTSNVTGVRLLLPAASLTNRTEVSIDGQPLSYAPGETLDAWRLGETWSKSDPKSGQSFKKAGVEGPIRDVFLDRVTFVYGSGDEGTRRANREVAESFGRFHSGMDIDYPVVPDVELGADVASHGSLVLVGTARDHSLLARLAARLPVTATARGIAIGDQLIAGADVGAIFIHPNPEHPNHYVVVITAPSPAGIWRALSLPRLLPDFVVYDRALADAATEQVLGTAKVRAAGFFGNDWSLPAAAGLQADELAGPTKTP